VQNVFIGATIAWFAWKDAIAQMHLAGDFRNFWISSTAGSSP